MATSAFASTRETTNANRTCRVLLGPCSDQLRDVLRHYVPPVNFPNVVWHNKSKLSHLTLPQRDLILPKTGSYSGNYSDMDISLLYTLLRNMCNIPPHKNGWGKCPDVNDASLAANIERIREERNKVGHFSSTSLSHTDFNNIWSKIKDAVKSMDTFLKNSNKYEKEMDFLFTETMDPQQEFYINQLRKQIEEDTQTRETVKQLNESVNDQRGDIKKLRTDQQELHRELTDQQGAIQDLQHQQQELQRQQTDQQGIYRTQVMPDEEPDLNRLKARLVMINDLEIPLTPLQEDSDKLPVEQLFASVIIKEDSKETSKGRKSAQFRKEQEVKTLDDMLTKNGKPVRHVYMLGDAAHGKTTYCTWLLKTWCNAKKPGMSGRPLNEWENALSQFDFVFHLKFRHVDPSKANVTDMICQNILGEDTGLHRAAKHVLFSDRYHCLIIMDGLDKWKPNESVIDQLKYKGIPNIENMSNCVIFTTMRPWMFPAVAGLVRDEDRVIEIQGLAVKDDDSTIPLEIRAMGIQSLNLFKKSLKEGKYKSYVIRVMIVGHYGVGKTTLTKKLLRLKFDPSKYESTEGLEIYKGHCYMDWRTGKWTHGIKRKNKSLAEDLRDHGVIDDMKEELKKIAKGEEKETDSEEERGRVTMYTPVQESTEEEEHIGKTETLAEDLRDYGIIDAKKIDSEVERGGKGKTESLPDDIHPHGVIDGKTIDSEVERRGKVVADTNVGKTDTSSNLLKAVLEEEASQGEDKYTSIEIWDFGGQGGYCATHQSFLSHRSIYLLVFNISKNLDHYIDDMDLDPSEKRKSTVKEFLSFWINSIKTYSGDGMGNYPKILVVGTHLDEVDTAERRKRVKEYMSSIQGAYEKDIADGHLILDENLMFGLHEDDSIEILQKAITNTAEDQPFWGEELPKAWIFFQHHISGLRQSGKEIISMDKIIDFNESLIAPLDKDNIDLCLRFLHSVGSIMFYSGSSLSNYVIIEPLLLVHTLRSLITCEIFCTQGARKGAYLGLQHDGMISQEQIDKIWKLPEFSSLEPYKEHLLTVMERLDLIAKRKTYQNGSIIDSKLYFIPSMAKGDPENEEWCTKIMESNRVQTVEIDFSKSFLSPAVYYRVISSCIGIWPVTQGKLYFGCCQLSLDTQHRMLIRKKGDTICLVFEHRRDTSSLNRSLIKTVVEVVDDILQHIIESYPGRRNDNVYEVKGNFEKVSHIPTESDECPKSCPGKGKDILQRTPSELELMRFVKNLVGAKDKYYMIGVNLVGIIETEQAEHNCKDNLYLKLFYILVKWLRKKGSACSFEELVKTAECDPHIICKILHDKDVKVYETIPTTRLEETCTDEMIDSISSLIGEDFMHFGLELGLGLADIEEIKSDPDNGRLIDFNNSIMKATRDRKRGANLSVRSVCCALLRINRFDRFEEFVNQFIHKKEYNIEDW